MSSLPDDSRDGIERFWEQLAEVQRVAPEGLTYLVEPAEAAPGAGIEPRYVYEANIILVPAADMTAVRRYNTTAPDEDGAAPGVRRLRLDDGIHVPTEVRRINSAYLRDNPGTAGPGGGAAGGAGSAGSPAGRRPPLASPNHLVSIAGVNLCPAAEPRPVPPVTPLWPRPGPAGAPAATTAGPAGTGVSVLVIDTGFQPGVADRHPLLAGVTMVGGPRQEFGSEPGLATVIKEYAGHGTFVTGVLLTEAPGASVQVSSLLQGAGALDEDALGGGIMALLNDSGRPWPQIISISGGSTTQDSQSLTGLVALLDELALHPETVLIAAAGNDGSSTSPLYPAGDALTHPGVISVGALRRDGRGRACFSNFGDWVTVYTYGEDVINYFPAGTYAYQHGSTAACRYRAPALYPDCSCVTPTRYGDLVAFDGIASWSGTSFAAPRVAGMVAAHMTRTGEASDARAAARDLLARYATAINDAADQRELLALR
ncbi:MAG TPA: S8/S53 family peptidase [Streptosporangiaceae bacterium]